MVSVAEYRLFLNFNQKLYIYPGKSELLDLQHLLQLCVDQFNLTLEQLKRSAIQYTPPKTNGSSPVQTRTIDTNARLHSIYEEELSECKTGDTVWIGLDVHQLVADHQPVAPCGIVVYCGAEVDYQKLSFKVAAPASTMSIANLTLSEEAPKQAQPAGLMSIASPTLPEKVPKQAQQHAQQCLRISNAISKLLVSYQQNVDSFTETELEGAQERLLRTVHGYSVSLSYQVQLWREALQAALASAPAERVQMAAPISSAQTAAPASAVPTPALSQIVQTAVPPVVSVHHESRNNLINAANESRNNLMHNTVANVVGQIVQTLNGTQTQLSVPAIPISPDTASAAALEKFLQCTDFDQEYEFILEKLFMKFALSASDSNAQNKTMNVSQLALYFGTCVQWQAEQLHENCNPDRIQVVMNQFGNGAGELTCDGFRQFYSNEFRTQPTVVFKHFQALKVLR